MRLSWFACPTLCMVEDSAVLAISGSLQLRTISRQRRLGSNYSIALHFLLGHNPCGISSIDFDT